MADSKAHNAHLKRMAASKKSFNKSLSAIKAAPAKQATFMKKVNAIAKKNAAQKAKIKADTARSKAATAKAKADVKARAARKAAASKASIKPLKNRNVTKTSSRKQVAQHSGDTAKYSFRNKERRLVEERAERKRIADNDAARYSKMNNRQLHKELKRLGKIMLRQMK